MRIEIACGKSGYGVEIQRGLLNRAGEYLNLNRKVMIVTDSGVPSEYAEALAGQAAEAYTAVMPAGESAKSPENFLRLLKTMLDAGFTRGDCLAAIGGGVPGDLGGFAASCYMRGIDFYNIPTTLLSCVDSSVGGKTAVNLEGVKNAVGSFYPPERVLIDPSLLKTLPDREFNAGLAEVIKMALTLNGALFEKIERSTDIRADAEEIIAEAVKIKKSVVEQDPEEAGLRRVLNFGHTVGHAVESAEKGRLLHGECVALGMLPMCSEEVRERLKTLLKRYGLPVRPACGPEEYKKYLLHDKKRAGEKIRCVYVPSAGSYEFRDMTPEEILKRAEKLL